MQSKNFLLLYDLLVRDKQLIEDIAKKLLNLGYSTEIAKLADEKLAHSICNFDVVVINKPHFFDPFRLRKKFFGTKYVVLDTEGILPGENSQHCLLEPDVYLHWFSHQAERYNFKKTEQFVVGYPRAYQLKNVRCKNKKLITIATNFSAMGYSDNEIDSRARARNLKLVNDWSLKDYKSFQEESFQTILKLIKHNQDYNFIIKAHPNDPMHLWKSFDKMNLANVEIFDHNKDINALISHAPNFHFCLDGCTTILDAYVCDIPVVSINRFKPLSKSVLRSLEYANVSNENLNIDFIGTNKKPLSLREKKFIEELKLPSLDLIVSGIIAAKNNHKVFNFHHAPTKMHFRHFFRLIFESIIKKNRKPSSRKKMGTGN